MIYDTDYTPAVDEALDALVSSNGYRFQLRVPDGAGDEICNHPRFSGLADFGDDDG